MRRKIRMTALAAIGGLALVSGGCAYHGGGYGYYGGGHCHSDPAAAVIVGTAALFYAIGNACH